MGRVLMLSWVLLLLGGSSTMASTSADESAARSVVVTTEVLGAVVRPLVGDGATVTILMGPGADPHTWQPSARDSEAVLGADIVIANGLGLEEGLLPVLAQAEAAGVRVFRAGDHVRVRQAATDEHGDADAHDGADEHGDADAHDGADEHEGADSHEHALGDPHFWLDPLAMRDVVLKLGPALAAAGIVVGDRPAELAAQLEALDAELEEMLASVPAEQRQLVTGHGALGYFADRYGFRIVGTVVPGLSSADEPSARDIAELIANVRATGTRAVFVDGGTPQPVAAAVAQDAGASIVALAVERLPASGSYADLLHEVASTIADALAD